MFFFRYFLVFVVLIFSVFQMNIHKIYGFSIYPDEFGYWASAAKILGYDWSDVTSLGSYYSYGYGIILAPILRIFRDNVMAYRAAVVVNMILQCGAVGMLWGIFRRLHRAETSKEKRMQAILAVGMAVFYPPWSFFVQMTMAEALLMFLYVCICYQIVLFVEKPSMTGAGLLALSLLYMYFVHMRTVAVTAAAVLTLVLYAWNRPSARKTLVIALIVFTVGLLCGLWAKERVTSTVYAATDAELLSANDYAGNIGRLKSLFSLRGMKGMLFSSIGKLYYLTMASFGLFLPAVSVCVKKTWKILKSSFVKPESGQSKSYLEREYFYLFCLLSVMGQFAMTAIVTMSPARLDGFVYGRYNEHLMPVFVGIGLLAVCEIARKLRVFMINAVVSTVLFAVTMRNAFQSGLTVMHGYFASGISYLSDDWNYDVKEEFWKAYLFGMFLTVCVMVCIYIGKRHGKYIYALGTVLFMEIVLALCLQKKYTVYFNEVNYYDMKISKYISEHAGQELPVTYLYSGGFPSIDQIQFDLKDNTIEIIRLQDLESWQNYMSSAPTEKGTDEAESLEPESIFPESGFLIVDQGCGYLEEIEQRYQKCAESYSFVLFLAE